MATQKQWELKTRHQELEATIARELESLSIGFVQTVNDRDFTPVTQSPRVARDFKAHYENATYSLDEHLEVYRRIQENYPEYRTKIVSNNADVNVNTGVAKVYLLQETSGAPVGVVRTTQVVFDFKAEAEGWMCVGVTVMRHGGPAA